jgi:hypothetical protein
VTLVTLPYRSQLAAGQPEDIGMVLADFDAVLAVLNGDIRNDNISPSAALSASKLAGYPADANKWLNGLGGWTVPGGGAFVSEVAYQANAVDISIVATSQAGATTCVTAPAFTADGAGVYWVEYFCGNVYQDSNMRQVVFRLFVDGTGVMDCGSAGAGIGGGVTGPVYETVHIRVPHTPSAGSHTYSMRAYMLGGSGTSHADGTRQQFIRITKER